MLATNFKTSKSLNLAIKCFNGFVRRLLNLNLVRLSEGLKMGGFQNQVIG